MAIVRIPYPKEAMDVCLQNPKIDTTKPHEVRLLCLLAARQEGNILEVGTHYGDTTKELAYAIGPRRLVFSADFITDNPTMHDRQRGEMPSMDTVGRAARGIPNVRFLFGDSKHINYHGMDIGFVFIDGDHTLDGVRSDTEHVLQAFDAGITRPRLMIAWHDVYDHPGEPWIGVKRYLSQAPFDVAHYIGTDLAVMDCAQ